MPGATRRAQIGAEAKDGAQRSLRLWRHVSKLQERKAQATGSGALPLMNTFMNPDSFSKVRRHAVCSSLCACRHHVADLPGRAVAARLWSTCFTTRSSSRKARPP